MRSRPMSMTVPSLSFILGRLRPCLVVLVRYSVLCLVPFFHVSQHERVTFCVVDYVIVLGPSRTPVEVRTESSSKFYVVILGTTTVRELKFTVETVFQHKDMEKEVYSGLLVCTIKPGSEETTDSV